ncbi:hypothetical protein FXO37_30201 [Capsicum annuum]|nr:hypothetical protein FXO37_30201 [Capsicum annuum]
MQAVHRWTDRQLIVLNTLNQPIGPTKAVITEFSSFLGTLARNGTFCPLNLSWTKLKTHDDMWSYIQEKYDISNKEKNWAMRSINAAFRGYKSRLKKDHFYAYTSDGIRVAKRPTSIPEPVFEDLLKYWNSEKLRYDINIGNYYIIVEMKRVETQESEYGTQSTDAFTIVMGPHHPGRVEKRLDELEERMQQTMNAQRDFIEREVTMNISAQLQRLNPRLTLDPNMLGFNVHSSREALSNQPISCLSVGSNNQGVQNEERDKENDEDIDLT